jgi:hypothetical protein
VAGPIFFVFFLQFKTRISWGIPVKIWRKSGQILLSKKEDLVAFLIPLSYPNESPIKCLKTTQHYYSATFIPQLSLPFHIFTISFQSSLILSSIVACFLWVVQSEAMAVETQTQFHVLAVDDSVLDRKLIERLLKTSSYHGILVSFLNLLPSLLFN